MKKSVVSPKLKLKNPYNFQWNQYFSCWIVIDALSSKVYIASLLYFPVIHIRLCKWQKNFDKELFSSTGLFMDWKLQTEM